MQSRLMHYMSSGRTRAFVISQADKLQQLERIRRRCEALTKLVIERHRSAVLVRLNRFLKVYWHTRLHELFDRGKASVVCRNGTDRAGCKQMTDHTLSRNLTLDGVR